MRLVRIIFILLFGLSCVGASFGQVPTAQQSNFRTASIPVQPSVPYRLDTLSIIPSTFKIKGIDSSAYRLDYVNATLWWKHLPADSVVQVSYRVFPLKLNAVTQRMNYDSLLLYSTAPIRASFDDKAGAGALFNFGNINAQGSFGRQIGFGNNQDVVLNSNLNVQLSGMLADSIELQAAITDNNVPIQPDGNTQQLNEFDEVYIRFKKKNWSLNVGDMDLKENRSYFLNFYKRLQGISFQTTNAISKSITSHTLVSGSIAKGKFSRNTFQGLEGNQGPYRLSGVNSELFLIVLANTERVFIDGILLQRGEDQDYVINYNTAEITFTPKHMITKDSRIQVEFEYADRNFLNTNLFAMQEVDFKKRLKLRIGYFGNTDAKNSSINQVLDAQQKNFLYRIGNNIDKALYPSAVKDTLLPGKILYEKVYITENNIVVDSFYRHSTDPKKAKYNLTFTELGQGKGNYIPDQSNANGKVFVYVPPAKGLMQGNFEPLILLVTPKKQQLFTLGADYSISNNTILKTEVAASNYDVNTFSPLNDNDDKGYAAKIGLRNTQLLKEKNKLSLVSSLGYEYVQDRFQPLERLRNVEFSRDWGLSITPKKATENIIKAATGLRSDKGNSVQYQFTGYHRSDHYKGFQNALTHIASYKNWNFNNQVVLTNYNTDTYRGHFLRPIIDVSQKLPWLKNWMLGGKYTLEQNVNWDKLADTLKAETFSFDTYTVYLTSGAESKNKYNLNFYTRSDQHPSGKKMIRGDRSYNLNFRAELLSNAKRQFYLNTTFRKLKVYNEAASRQTEDNTVLARAEYQMNEWNGFINGNVLYEVGSGQEQKRAYAYLEVPAGTGQYTWIDYNQDGIQQLNEFELAAFADQAKFIRVFTPTNGYIKANYTTLNYNINVTPKKWYAKKGKAASNQLPSRFILNSSMQVSKKSLAKGLFEFNPFGYELKDNNLITLSTILANTLSFNRENTKWGLDISNLRNNSKALLTYGYETRQNNEWILKHRHFLSTAITLNLNMLSGNNGLFTDDKQFSNRNYNIEKHHIETLLSFIRNTTFRVTGGYKYEVKNNASIYGGEKSTSHVLTAESKYNVLQSTSLTGKFTYNSLNYKCGANTAQTTIGYVMLDGLLPGSNYIWNVILTKRLLNNLELNIQYDGRKPGTGKLVHTGRVSITAIF